MEELGPRARPDQAVRVTSWPTSIKDAGPTLWALLWNPARVFDERRPAHDHADALRFRIITAAIPPLAVAAMLATGLGLGEQTAAGLGRLGGLEIGLAALTLLGLPALGVLGSLAFGAAAHAVLPDPAGSRSQTSTVVLLAFGVRAFCFLPGFELPTLFVAAGLVVFGLSRSPGVSALRATVATGAGLGVAGLIQGLGVVAVLVLEAGLES